MRLGLRSGEYISLVKDVRFYIDTQGKSFGLSGKDMLGRPQQHVFHRGQFADEKVYHEAVLALQPYK